MNKKIKITYGILFSIMVIFLFLPYITSYNYDYMGIYFLVYMFGFDLLMCICGIIIGTDTWKQMLLYLFVAIILCFYIIILKERYLILGSDGFFNGIAKVIERAFSGDMDDVVLVSFNGFIAAVIGEVIALLGRLVYHMYKEIMTDI